MRFCPNCSSCATTISIRVKTTHSHLGSRITNGMPTHGKILPMVQDLYPPVPQTVRVENDGVASSAEAQPGSSSRTPPSSRSPRSLIPSTVRLCVETEVTSPGEEEFSDCVDENVPCSNQEKLPGPVVEESPDHVNVGLPCVDREQFPRSGEGSSPDPVNAVPVNVAVPHFDHEGPPGPEDEKNRNRPRLLLELRIAHVLLHLSVYR